MIEPDVTDDCGFSGKRSPTVILRVSELLLMETAPVLVPDTMGRHL